MLLFSVLVEIIWYMRARIVSWNSGDVVVKLLVFGSRSSGLIPGLAAAIAEIGYLLLKILNMAEISLKQRKSSKQRPTVVS